MGAIQISNHHGQARQATSVFRYAAPAGKVDWTGSRSVGENSIVNEQALMMEIVKNLGRKIKQLVRKGCMSGENAKVEDEDDLKLEEDKEALIQLAKETGIKALAKRNTFKTKTRGP